MLTFLDLLSQVLGGIRSAAGGTSCREQARCQYLSDSRRKTHASERTTAQLATHACKGAVARCRSRNGPVCCTPPEEIRRVNAPVEFASYGQVVCRASKCLAVALH